ncbi:MAG: tRNA uridine-5-carboxymethylaminomethyl(34) synthesis GTPase MnmE [Saprospiraceae bacterium]|nr:tRNA uridine-5-carboxymethylaminomethyl(34) synthesis GTPase MnmE [Saprospiraceae bacterium]
MNPRILESLNPSDTIVAPATATGEAAIAMIRVSGPRAYDYVGAGVSRLDINSKPANTTHVGEYIIGPGPEIADEVVVALYRAPRSYTGEDLIEITCHGSDLIVQKILTHLIKQGARLAEPGEFTMRAFLNGKLDLAQAESVADLIAAQSDAAHRLALNQLRGGISKEITALRQQLIDFASLLELELDFAEEDVEFANRAELKQLVSTIRTVVGQLIESFAYGNAIRSGVMTVIAGRPNAGKSTLLNALLQDERAIVSEIPGTTRDTIEEAIQIEGIRFRLVDTAGLREATDQIEAIGVERALEKVGQSAIVVYVFDVTQLSAADVNRDVADLKEKTTHTQLIAVANKMDLHPHAHAEEWSGEHLPADRILPLSAKNQMNIAYLKEQLVAAVRSGDINPDLPIIANARHHQALLRVDEALQAVQKGFDEGVTSDFIAMDLRQALHWLGEITGEVTTDDLLGNIFANFCIGK